MSKRALIAAIAACALFATLLTPTITFAQMSPKPAVPEFPAQLVNPASTENTTLQAQTAPKWAIQTLDQNAYDSGKILIDQNNNPHIAYDEFVQGIFTKNHNVMYASWNGSAWNIQNVTQYNTADLSSVGYFGSFLVDFALGANGNPHILFSHDSDHGLYYTYWNGSGWSTQTVDLEATFGSLALDSDGNAHIAYAATGNTTFPTVLKYATQTGSNWTTQIIDASSIYSPFGPSVSLQLDPDNNPHIMYETVNNTIFPQIAFPNVKYAVGNGSSWSIQTLYENAGNGNMVLDSEGYPHAVITEYTGVNNTYVYASWNGESWINQTLPFTAEGYLALDSLGNPHVDYINYAPDSFIGALMYASWNGESWSIQTVDPSNAGNAGTLALDSYGNPHIAYEGQSPDQGQSAYYYYLNYATAVEPLPSSTPTSTSAASSSPPIPEFPTWAVLPLLIIAVSIVGVYLRRKLKTR